MITPPDGPVWCPTSSRPPQSRQSKPNTPADGSFDTRILLRMTEEQAIAKVRDAGCLLRVIGRDGHGFALRADFRANRVNVTIEQGRVTSVGVY